MFTISISTLLPRGWLFDQEKNSSHYSLHLCRNLFYLLKPCVVGGVFNHSSLLPQEQGIGSLKKVKGHTARSE